jgi:hypothetical protein
MFITSISLRTGSRKHANKLSGSKKERNILIILRPNDVTGIVAIYIHFTTSANSVIYPQEKRMIQLLSYNKQFHFMVRIFISLAF